MFNKIKLKIGQPKYKFVNKVFSRNDSFKILDIGGGSGASLLDVLRFFPNASYFCVDLFDESDYKEKNIGRAFKYYQIDLESLDLSLINDDFFDVVICSHVIEHLANGDQVLAEIFKKIKPLGYIYVEYPGENSLSLPSMPGTLNFFDDPTHCRIYSIIEMNNIFLRHGIKPLKSGTRRNWCRIPLLPLLLFYKMFKSNNQGTIAYEFWDLSGFAEFIFGQKMVGRCTVFPDKFK